MKRICLAKISAPHGIKGLVKVLFYGEDLSLLSAGSLYTSETGTETLALTLKNPSGKFYLAQVDGVNDRDGADSLKGTELYINRDVLPDIAEEGTFYYEDLIGLSAVDQDGNKSGVVIAVHNFGAGDLLEIKPERGESFLLPFTDEYVPKIRTEDIVINPPDDFV